MYQVTQESFEKFLKYSNQDQPDGLTVNPIHDASVTEMFLLIYLDS